MKTSSKMATIVDELLLLASVRQVNEVTLEPLDMASIVARAQERLATVIAEYQAEVILPQELPRASGYGPWVEEVWSNYISNAIRYGGRPDKGAPPRVELGADRLSPSDTSSTTIPVDLPEALVALPPDLLNALEQAARQAAMKRVNRLVADIHTHNAALADALTALADEFAYDEILALIESQLE